VTARRAIAGAIVLAAAVAGVAVAAVWTHRIDLAQWWIARRAESLGLRPVRLRVASLDLHGIAIESIAIGPADAPDLAIQRLDAAWSPASLRAGRFDSLRVAGVALHGRIGPLGPTVGALDPLWKSGAPRTKPPELPAPQIALETAKVRIDTLRGPATGGFGGSLRETAGGIAGEFDLDVAGAGATARGQLAIEGTLREPSFRLHLDPLRAGALALSLDTRGTAPHDAPIALGPTTLGVVGGTLHVDGLKLDLAARRISVPVLVDDVDLAALLALVAVEGLEGSGRIEGTLPVVRENGKLAIDDGLLRATGDGTLRYTPTESVRSLSASRPEDLGLAVDAFSDFRYELLEARVAGDLDGALAIGLHVRGSNPAFQKGRGVELNLKLEAHLLDLVRAGVAAYRVPERIEERVRERSEGAK
jgi:hypothetical protein